MSDEAPLTPAQAAFVKRRRLIPAIIGIGLLLQHLDGTILANALPAIGRDFGESPLMLNHAIAIYLLSAAVFLPISGWVSDRFGARRIFMVAIVAFATTSLLCGFAQNSAQLIGGRFLQGMAGALMMPVGRTVLLKSAPKKDLVDALATVTMPALLGPIIGPPIGGFIVEFASWRWIFWVNAPIAVLGFFLIWRFIPVIEPETTGPPDIKGFLYSAACLAGIVFGVQNARDFPWPVTAALIVAGFVAGALFVRHARRVSQPILDLSVMRVPTYFISNVGGAMIRSASAAIPFLTALQLQLGFGLNAFSAGAIACVGAAGALLMKTAAPPLLRRFGFRRVLLGNAAFTAISIASIGLLQPSTPVVLMLLAIFAAGFFRSLQFTALNALAYGDLAPEQISRASALQSVGQQIIQSLGVTIAAAIVSGLSLATGAPALSATVIAPAFVVFAGFTLISVPFFLRLAPDAGGEMAGRRR